MFCTLKTDGNMDPKKEGGLFAAVVDFQVDSNEIQIDFRGEKKSTWSRKPR